MSEVRLEEWFRYWPRWWTGVEGIDRHSSLPFLSAPTEIPVNTWCTSEKRIDVRGPLYQSLNPIAAKMSDSLTKCTNRSYRSLSRVSRPCIPVGLDLSGRISLYRPIVTARAREPRYT